MTKVPDLFCKKNLLTKYEHEHAQIIVILTIFDTFDVW